MEKQLFLLHLGVGGKSARIALTLLVIGFHMHLYQFFFYEQTSWRLVHTVFRLKYFPFRLFVSFSGSIPVAETVILCVHVMLDTPG